MRANAVDVVMFFDLDFVYYRLSTKQLAAIEPEAQGEKSLMQKRFEKSFGWLFYSPDDSPTLPGLQRIDVTHLLAADSGAKGASLLVYAEYGIAVAAVWRSLGATDDVTGLLNQTTFDDGGLIDALDARGLGVHDRKREYPFTAITIDQDDLRAYVSQHVLELGRLLPGGIEHEEEQYLRRPIENDNLSRRDYERLYLTWTDALALYSQRGVDQKTVDRTFFRAMQIYETCILVSRLFTTLQTQMDETYASMRVWKPRPLRVNALLESVKKVNRDLVNSPPVQSIEAGRLLNGAFKAFELDREASHAADRAAFLETRFQWSKTQLLACAAIVTFILNHSTIFTYLLDRVKNLLLHRHWFV